MSLNKEQVSRFEAAAHWYKKASGKISKRYYRGVRQKKETRYAEVVVSASELTEEIDKRYKLVLKGECGIDEFKEAISDWFYKVKNGMDAVDLAAREAGEPWCDFYDEREEE